MPRFASPAPADTAHAHYAPALRALSRARSALVLNHPFFGSLALRMSLRCDEACPGLWTDGRTLACNPLYAASASEKTLVSAVAHEILHIALGHHLRRGRRDEAVWNRACDYAVNAILLESGFALPEGALYSKIYADRSVDDIYAALARLQDDASRRAALGSGGEESDESEGEGGFGPEGGAPRQSQSRRPGPGDAGGQGQTQEHGARAADRREGRPRPAGPVFSGEVRDHPLLHSGTDGTAGALAEQEADIALVQAAQEALRMGDMPAGLSRLVRRRIRPAIDWREQLSRFLEQCSDSDYSWTRPNRRYVSQGLYLPSRHEAKLPELVLAIDCSGSVDEALLSRFCAELSGLLEAWDAALTVLYHDVAVTGSARFTRQDMPFRLMPVSGGGTDYRPVPAAIEDMGLSPACVLWFTDLECSRFPEEPGWPVLWISSQPGRQAPPFGEVLSLPAR